MDPLTHNNDKPSVTVTKAGVMQVQPAAIIRSSSGMKQIRQMHKLFVRVSQKQDGAASGDKR